MQRLVPEAVKAERLATLQALLAAQQHAFNQGVVGATLPVLFERAGRKPGQLIGRSPYMQAVHASAPARLKGAIAEVRISAAEPNSLRGTLIHAGHTGRDAPAERMEARA